MAVYVLLNEFGGQDPHVARQTHDVYLVRLQRVTHGAVELLPRRVVLAVEHLGNRTNYNILFISLITNIGVYEVTRPY